MNKPKDIITTENLDFAKDIIGQKFGLLTIKNVVGKNKNNRVVYECQCDCGNICYRLRNEFLRPKDNIDNISCGCYWNNKVERRALELVNSKCKYNMLTPIGIDKIVLDNRKEKTAYIKCKCDCGNEASIEFFHLISGETKSCGCIKGMNWNNIVPNISRSENMYIRVSKDENRGFTSSKLIHLKTPIKFKNEDNNNGI